MFLDILSTTALASTFAFFACGIQVCYKIRENGHTEGINPAPFLMTLLSCVMMLQYGILRDDNVVILCNLVGAVLEGIYVAYYYYMTHLKRRIRRYLFIELFAVLAMEWMVQGMGLPDRGLAVLGVVCMVLNISAIAAPLASVQQVFRTKSAASLPVPICIASFIVSIQWLLYGILVDDPVIKYPNYISTFLSTIQLALIIIYGTARKPKIIYMDEL
ncbi:unnamed protein product, partial [Mesorhabditis spiculigera]